MNKFILIIFALALSGCGKWDYQSLGGGLAVYRDSLTGCEYLRPIGYSALTPRVDADGKHICR